MNPQPKTRKVEAHKITDSACDKLKTTGFDGIGRTSFNRANCAFFIRAKLIA
jgi:hypothetical protein